MAAESRLLAHSLPQAMTQRKACALCPDSHPCYNTLLQYTFVSDSSSQYVLQLGWIGFMHCSACSAAYKTTVMSAGLGIQVEMYHHLGSGPAAFLWPALNVLMGGAWTLPGPGSTQPSCWGLPLTPMTPW